MKFKVVGVGGIGCCLLPVLSRFLNFSFPRTEVTLIDGDSYTEDNGYRQTFDRLGNKAEVTAERLEKEFPQLFFRAKAVYLTEDNVFSLLREEDIIFLGVDNHATRKLVSDRCEELSDVVLISGGNFLTDGNIQIFVRKEGTDLTLPLTNEFHPEIQNPADRNPDEIGCDELVESEPQLLITNNAIAASMLSAFYAHLQGNLDYDEVYVDILTGNCRQVCRR